MNEALSKSPSFSGKLFQFNYCRNRLRLDVCVVRKRNVAQQKQRHYMKYQNYVLTDQENYILTEHERNRSQKSGKKLSALEELYPEFSALCADTKHMTEWAHLEAYSKYTLSKIRNFRKPTIPSSTLFFARSRTHEVLFYRLLLAASAAIQKSDMRIGVSLSEVLEYMTLAELKSDRACRTTLKLALDEGYIEETKWGMDRRVKVLFLSPISIMDYINWGFESHFQAAIEANLPAVNALIEREKKNKQKSLPEILSSLNL